MSESACRWGILSTAGIARKNWQAILNAPHAQLTAVASRDVARAQQFIDTCQAQVPHPELPAAVGSYAELLQRDDVDAVYIPLPTGLRREWAVRAAEAGKHVMAEKPCGVNADDVAAMVEACRTHGVQFMDGVMFMHSQRLPLIRHVLDHGTGDPTAPGVGTIKRISVAFTFMAPDDFLRENIRVQSGLEPLGCLGDLGWYTIRIALWTLNYQMPTRVSGRLLSSIQAAGSKAATPTEFSAELQFPDGVSAGFYCTFLAEHQQWVHISGSQGFLTIDDFVLPRVGNELEFQVINNRFIQQGCTSTMEEYPRRYAVPEFGNNHVTAQETRLFDNFSRMVVTGRLEPEWGDIAIKTQRVMDACYQSAQQDGAWTAVSS